MNNTTYVSFSAYDYKGEYSLSSYALSITPLHFVSEIPTTDVYKPLWDFGDGTYSDKLSPYKSYNFPGKYTVSLVIYDCDKNAQVSSVKKEIVIKDYIEYTFSLKLSSYVITEDGSFIVSEGGDYLISTESQLITKNGKISGPIGVTGFFPPYRNVSDIYYRFLNSDSYNYWNYKSDKFVNLINTYSVYDKIYNYSLSSYQFREIDKVEFDGYDDKYVRLDGTSIIECSETDEGACYIGKIAESTIYIKDDCVNPNLLVKFNFDRKKIPINNSETSDYVNNLGVTLSARISENTPDSINITSNGYDGEKYPIDSFNIYPIKYFNTKIPFVVKVKDDELFTIKNLDTVSLSDINFKLYYSPEFIINTEDGEPLLDEYGNTIIGDAVDLDIDSSYYSISSLEYTLSAYDHGGSFRGYIVFNTLSTRDLLQNVKLTVGYNLTTDTLSNYTLSASSNYFNVYTKNYFDFYKVNEDFNAKETIKDLRFQETLIDKTILFDDFIGGILGDSNSDHDTIGLKSYEKIANFISNTQDIETCELEFLDSLGSMVGYEDKEESKLQFPNKVKRLVDTFSIDKHKLIGTSNKFKENFNIKGDTQKTIYGINLGNQIDVLNYIVTAGEDIVALEKFSNNYTRLNSYQPVSSYGSHIYPLSSYSPDWGWPLVLPNITNPSDLDKYYIFFEFNDQIDGNTVGAVIDFDNTNTNIETDIIDKSVYNSGEVFDNMILDTLYQSLSLINS